MTPDALQPQTPSEATGLSQTGDRRLLQQRLALLAGIASAVAFAFWVAGMLLGLAGIDRPLATAGHASLLGTIALLVGVGLYCRRGVRPMRVLLALDAVVAVLAGLLVLVGLGSIPEPELRGMVMLLEVTLLLYMRSIFVPSTARRTFAIGVAASLPLVAYALSQEPLRLSAWKLMWLAAAIAVSTAGSAVIYGLRRAVRHARQLGQYTLEEKLGEGGMGVVYRARHALLRRPTAVKLLKPERMGEANLRRFEREVQLTAGLSHPNTVSVFDFGRTPDGVFYYAMEYLDGLTLDELVRGDGAQPPARVVHVLKQVLGALAEAHGIGLVHRDVKPGNVVLCERGGVADVAKVLDFGLVKELEGASGLSLDRGLVGTPQYLAPEAIRSAAADPRADLYSVGAVAYFLLTGRHVFEGRTVIEICGQHLHERPVPPSERLGRPLPHSLEQWVLACLEKDPDRRPRSAAAAAAALERCAPDEAWTAEAARAWWAGRGRALVALRRQHPAVPDALTLSRPVVERAGF